MGDHDDMPPLLESSKEDYSIFSSSVRGIRSEVVSDESIKQFSSITNAGEKVSRAFLERHHGDLNQAIRMFFENPNPRWLREAMEPKVLEPDDLDDFKNLSNLERCTARAASVLRDLEKKLRDEKDTSARDLLKKAMEGNINVIPERMADLAITLCIVKKGMKDVKSDDGVRFGMKLPVARKLLKIFEDCHLNRYHHMTFQINDKCRVMLVAILHELLIQIQKFCDETKPGDVLPPSLIASIVTISRPYLRIYLNQENDGLRNDIRRFLSTKTNFWSIYSNDLKRAGAVLELDRLLPIFYCLPEKETSVRILLDLYDAMMNMPMKKDDDDGVKILGVVRNRDQNEYAYWKDIFDPQEQGRHLTSTQKNGIRMSKRELETNQGRAQRLLDSFLLWTIQKQSDESDKHRLMVKHLTVWQNLAFRALKYDKRATVQRWGASQLEKIAQAIINDLIALFGKLQSDSKSRKLNSYPIYRHEGVDWGHLIDLLQRMERTSDETIRAHLVDMIEKQKRFAPLVNFVVWLERDGVVDTFLLNASGDEYVVKATEPFYQKLGRLDRLVSGVTSLQHRVKRMLSEAGVSRTSASPSPTTSPTTSLLLSILDDDDENEMKTSEEDEITMKELNILNAQKMLGLWSAAIAAKRIDERRALLDCIAILSPSCTYFVGSVVSPHSLMFIITGTSDVSTEFLCAIRNVVGKNLGIVVELLNSFRSRPPYGGEKSLKILMALIEITFSLATMANSEQPLVMSLLDFFIEHIEKESVRNHVVSHLIRRCALMIINVDDTRGLALVPSILYRFLGRRGSREDEFDTDKLTSRVSELIARLVETSAKEMNDESQDSNLLQTYLALLSRLIVIKKDYSKITLDVIGAAVKSSSTLSCALLCWISGTKSGRMLLSCPKSVNRVMHLTLTRLKDTQGTDQQQICEALWYTWYVTFVQEALRQDIVTLNSSKGTIETVSKEPHMIFLNETNSVGSDLWYLSVQSNTHPCVAKQAAKLFVELHAGVSSSSNNSSTSLCKRIINALNESKDNISGLLDMASMIVGYNSTSTEKSRKKLLQDFMVLSKKKNPEKEEEETMKEEKEEDIDDETRRSKAPSFPPPSIPKPKHLARPKDDYDDAVRRLLRKQRQVLDRGIMTHRIYQSDLDRDFVSSAVVVTHPNTSTVIRPGQKYRIRWQCTPQAEEAYCGETNVEIILTRNMDQELKKITQKFRNDGYSQGYAKQCARLLCSQICNTCRQYIAVSTALRAEKGKPDGWFDWIVPTDCPEGNYFVSLRTTDFNNAKNRLEWTKETTGPDAKFFVVRKSPALSESDVVDDYTIKERTSKAYRIRADDTRMRQIAEQFVHEQSLHTSTLKLLLSRENDSTSKLWNFLFLLKLFSKRKLSTIWKDLKESRGTKQKSVNLWELCVGLVSSSKDEDDVKLLRMRDAHEILEMICNIVSKKCVELDRVMSLEESILTWTCVRTMEEFLVRLGTPATTTTTTTTTQDLLQSVLSLARLVCSSKASISIVKTASNVLCMALKRSGVSRCVMKHMCSDKTITEMLCERSRRKARNRTDCVKFRRNVLKAQAFAALSHENKLDPDQSSAYLRLGLVSESSRYAVELLELLREARTSSSMYDLSTLMMVLRKSLFSSESRLRKGPRLVGQLELIREYVRTMNKDDNTAEFSDSAKALAKYLVSGGLFEPEDGKSWPLCCNAGSESIEQCCNVLVSLSNLSKELRFVIASEICAHLRPDLKSVPIDRLPEEESMEEDEDGTTSSSSSSKHSSCLTELYVKNVYSRPLPSPSYDSEHDVLRMNTHHRYNWLNMSMIQRPREPRKKHQPLGLYNLMNTCFANSVLQQLFTLPKTRLSLLDQDMNEIRSKMQEKQKEVEKANEELKVSTKIEESKEELKRVKSRLDKARREAEDSAREFAVRRQIQWTFVALQNQWCGPAVIPKGLIESCDMAFNHINMSRQNDCVEFFSSLVQICGLDKLFECTILSVRSRQTGATKPQYLKDTQYVIKLQVRSTLEKALNEFFEPKKTYLSKPPSVLALNLIRFVGKWQDNTMKFTKNRGRCKIPSSIDLAPYLIANYETSNDEDREKCVYELHGVIVHRGNTANSGHYYSFSRTSSNEQGEQWWEFNDDRVMKRDAPESEEFDRNCSGGENTSSQAYVLVYSRREGSSSAKETEFCQDFIPTLDRRPSTVMVRANEEKVSSSDLEVTQNVLSAVRRMNGVLMRESVLFSSYFFKLISSLVSFVPSSTTTSSSLSKNTLESAYRAPSKWAVSSTIIPDDDAQIDRADWIPLSSISRSSQDSDDVEFKPIGLKKSFTVPRKNLILRPLFTPDAEVPTLAKIAITSYIGLVLPNSVKMSRGSLIELMRNMNTWFSQDPKISVWFLTGLMGLGDCHNRWTLTLEDVAQVCVRSRLTNVKTLKNVTWSEIVACPIIAALHHARDTFEGNNCSSAIASEFTRQLMSFQKQKSIQDFLVQVSHVVDRMSKRHDDKIAVSGKKRKILDDVLEESDELVAGQRVQIFYEDKWYKATYKSSEKDPRRFIVICDVDRERQKPTKCPAHCVTLDMDTDLTDTFPPDKSVSTSMIDAWLDHNVMPAVTADVLLQVVFVRLCSKPEDTSHVMACLSKMTSLIRIVLMDPSLIRWKGRLSCDRFVLTIGKVAKTSRTRREALIRFFLAGKDVLWEAMLDSALKVFESMTTKNLVDTSTLCHHFLLVMCESFRSANRHEWYEKVVRKIFNMSRDLIEMSQDNEEKSKSKIQERAFRLLNGFVKIIAGKSSEIRDVIDSINEKESNDDLIAWLRFYGRSWASRVNELQRKFQDCTIKYANRVLHDNGGDIMESERILESKYDRVVDSEIDTKTREEDRETEDAVAPEPPELVVKSSKQFMSAIINFSGETAEQKKQDESYEYRDFLEMLNTTLTEDVERFTLRRGHDVLFAEFRKSLSMLRKRFPTNKCWSASRGSYYVLWDITSILEKIEGGSSTVPRTRIRVYKKFLNITKQFDGSSSEDEDEGPDIGGVDILAGGGVSQAIVPHIDPVQVTAVFEPDESSILQVQSVMGGSVDRERIVQALQKANGNADMAINYLFEL